MSTAERRKTRDHPVGALERSYDMPAVGILERFRLSIVRGSARRLRGGEDGRDPASIQGRKGHQHLAAPGT